MLVLLHGKETYLARARLQELKEQAIAKGAAIQDIDCKEADVREVLLATRDRELLKVYDTDYDWGTGADGTGENKMGKLWMKLRDELN